MLRTQILLDEDARCVGYEQTIHVIPFRVTMYRERQKKLEYVTEMGTSSNSFWTACRFHQICIYCFMSISLYMIWIDVLWYIIYIYMYIIAMHFFVYFQLQGAFISIDPALDSLTTRRPPRHCSWPLTSCTSEGTFWNNLFLVFWVSKVKW